jgi:hypothetical protein
MRAGKDWGVNPLLVFLPALGRSYYSATRLDQGIALLRAVEALRMYTAEHKNQWPAKLDDCTVPVPDDPVTGKPFNYSVDGGKAIIKAAGDILRDQTHVELTLRTENK